MEQVVYLHVQLPDRRALGLRKGQQGGLAAGVSPLGQAVARAIGDEGAIGPAVHGSGVGLVGEAQLFLADVLQVSRV